MSRQDKATTDRNARTLRELVKQPDNKACADCRKNDARWASWNLGVFLCIRCSGIHRSMGTHISKVKSIDLDMWTPEQMESVQRWGNRRANLYWEKHLKAGHVPPDHKIESFIRSKYESKRWAMDGPPPSDPAVLENGHSTSAPSPPAPSTRPTPTSTAPPPAPAQRATHPLLSRTAKPAATAAPVLAPVVNLFDDDEPPSFTSAPTPAPAPAPTTTSAPAPAPTAASTAAVPQSTAPPAQPSSSIFDLDFRAPATSSKPQTAKADIMSLFSNTSISGNAPQTAPPTQSFFSQVTSTNSAPIPATSTYSSWGGGITSSAQPTQHNPTQTSTAGWGGVQADQNAWGAPASSQPHSQVQAPGYSQPQAHAQTSQSQANVWGGNGGMAADPWASTGAVNTNGSDFGNGNGNGNGNGHGHGHGGFGGIAPVAAKKDDRDPFANIWG